MAWLESLWFLLSTALFPYKTLINHSFYSVFKGLAKGHFQVHWVILYRKYLSYLSEEFFVLGILTSLCDFSNTSYLILKFSLLLRMDFCLDQKIWFHLKQKNFTISFQLTFFRICSVFSNLRLKDWWMQAPQGQGLCFVS